MPRNRFAVPTTTRLEFDDGSDDWIEVKNELTYGESLDLSVAAAPRENEPTLSWLGRYYPARAALWLVDWSFCGADERAVELEQNVDAREEQIRALDQETGRELQRLLDGHEEAVRATGLGKEALAAGMEAMQETLIPLPPKASSSNTAA